MGISLGYRRGMQFWTLGGVMGIGFDFRHSYSLRMWFWAKGGVTCRTYGSGHGMVI